MPIQMKLSSRRPYASSSSSSYAMSLSGFLMQRSRTQKVFTYNKPLLVYERLPALSANMKLPHVDGRNGYNLRHIKKKQCRSEVTAIRALNCDETAYRHSLATNYLE